MTHLTCRLTAKNRDQLRNPALVNRVWVTFLQQLTFIDPPCISTETVLAPARFTNAAVLFETSLCSASYASCKRYIAQFAAERRPCANSSTAPARRARVSKPAAAQCGGRMGQLDRWTDRRTPDRHVDVYLSVRSHISKTTRLATSRRSRTR